MFRRITLMTTLMMLVLLSAIGNAQQSNPPQSNPQDPARTGQPTDRTRTDSRDSNRTQSDKSNDTTRQDSKMASSDREFAMKAAEGGKMEVMHAEMALQKSSNDEVKRYAQRIIDDHTKANQELMSIASGKGIMLPGEMHGQMHGTKSETRSNTTTNPSSATGATSPNTETSGDMRKTESGMKKSDMSKDHAMAMERMNKLSGAEFDREYLKMDLKDHKKAIELFEKQARSGRDAELKAFAEKTLPTLREHHQMARDIAGKMGVTADGTNR